MSAIFYGVSNFDVVASRDKKKVRRFAKRLRFAGDGVTYGCVPIQTFGSVGRYQGTFGPCVLYDLDQRLKFSAELTLLGHF